MKRIHTLLLISLVSFNLSGCNKTYETPKLLPFEVSNNACQNLVIFIGDGMGPNHVLAGELSFDKTYDFTSWNHSYSDTYSYNSFSDECVEITDSAAGGTAIATGETTINGRVGIDIYANDLPTILDYAKAMGKSTGIVTTDTIIGATPSDFSAHALDRSMSKEIIDTQLTSNIDVFIGQYCYEIKERKDEVEKHGYTYYSSFEEASNISKQKKAWCQYDFKESGGNITLKQATESAISLLSKNKKGYVLMVEQAHIDKRSHNNEFKYAAEAVDSLNDTIEYTKAIGQSNTGIIITADHETGGLSVSSEPISENKYGNAYYSYSSKSHTGAKVPVYVYGFDVNFSEFSTLESKDAVKNKDIFKIALFAITGNKY